MNGGGLQRCCESGKGIGAGFVPDGEGGGAAGRERDIERWGIGLPGAVVPSLSG